MYYTYITMKKVLFIINPASGGVDKAEVIAEIDRRFAGKDYSIYQTNGKNDAEKIAGIIDEMNVSSVVAGGGDGTVAMLADILKNKDVSLGILPLGSANGLAKELEIPTDVSESIDLLLAAQARPFDVIEINSKWNMLHLADVGLNATLVKRYHEDQHRGFMGYALSAIKELPNIEEPMQIEINADDKRYNFQSHFIGVANAKKYGTGVVINPCGRVDDGIFELCILNEISFQNLIENFVSDKELGETQFTIIPARNATISISPPTDFQIDGEYMGPIDHLEIKVANRQLQIIR